MGRFISADAFTTTDVSGVLSANMFAYCENNPVRFKDDQGTFINTAIGAIVGGLTSAISGGDATDIMMGALTGAIAGFGVDVAIATAGVAAPLAIAGGLGAISSGISSIYTQHKETGDFKWGLVVLDAAAGAVSNILALGVSVVKNPKTSASDGNLLRRICMNSKMALEDGALKKASHGARELVHKANYGWKVAGNITKSFSMGSVLSASNTFWSRRVFPCLTK